MFAQLIQIFDDSNSRVRSKLFGIYGVLVTINIVVWLWVLAAFHIYSVLPGTALLACGFGLRHAVDADHIAAIDNVTRKLMQEKKRPIAVGFFFSFGHSTVVVLASVVVALATTAIQGKFERFKEIGGIVGTLVSALFRKKPQLAQDHPQVVPGAAQHRMIRIAQRTLEPIAIEPAVGLHVPDGRLDRTTPPDHRAQPARDTASQAWVIDLHAIDGDTLVATVDVEVRRFC
ncbi:hypothetical protein BN2475_1030006 [Paraburkholderia ribeironis]|uniref:Nickel/cobalt efflux system n=1 Tax=Paraburkholderia ribeironis TaxID=1247936 RepID=A0A1N7SM04_9BURK|nr:hypothetical protein BN2475_1030006 [Paraburkholderia ribeironis]